MLTTILQSFPLSTCASGYSHWKIPGVLRHHDLDEFGSSTNSMQAEYGSEMAVDDLDIPTLQDTHDLAASSWDQGYEPYVPLTDSGMSVTSTVK